MALQQQVLISLMVPLQVLTIPIGQRKIQKNSIGLLKVRLPSLDIVHQSYLLRKPIPIRLVEDILLLRIL